MTKENNARRILNAQLLWLLLAALWNGVGVYRIAQGQAAIGPTASLIVAGVLLALAALLYVRALRWPLLWCAISLFGVYGAGSAVFGAITGDPSLWPTPFWRWSGAALNLFGLLACLLGILTAIKRIRG